MKRIAALLAASALTACLQTTNGAATAPVTYRPNVDMASAPGGGANFEKDLAHCQDYAGKSDGGTASQGIGAGMNSSFLSGALSSAPMLVANGGLTSGQGFATALGGVAATGATQALQDRATKAPQEATAASAAAAYQAEYVRNCLKTFGYTVMP